MEAKLYVGNLSFDTTEDELRNFFAQAGTVTEVALIKDRDTGSMSTQAEAKKAIEDFNGKTLGNREIKVNAARPPEDRSGGGYNNNRGGFRGNSGRNSGRGGGGGGGGGGNRRY
jgi:cold-inducible RNA-binding protein